ncbi:hypothetical protein B0W48_06770 [Pseudoalteromonas aliena]|uniref:GmrSD restriction endonucleases N-terminal domain-containing protein n=1 Tax=Pseudoalteromonas aliena TaxID=247523 RepID=A0A1Q2GWM0_9GAMM|nr:DUF262 domain-containing protein [Pseudoalteromonas aliena]AQP99529.1 hypothetical protein B0W48_06770 [Pseudoalteromonas aliena]
MKTSPTVEPRIYFIEDVIHKIASGEFAMPNFQRPYVWKREMILELFDSIYRGYPIGSILIWNPKSDGVNYTPSDFVGTRKVKQSLSPSYILDGQQRLTTFFMCLYEGQEINDDWNVYFDLKNEKFLHLKNKNKDLKNHYIPIRNIHSTSNFLDESMRIMDKTENREFVTRAQLLVDRIVKYRLACIELNGGDVDQAIEIFTRLNREGRKVSELDYVNALSKKDNSEGLKTLLDGIKEVFSKYNFQLADTTVYLKLIQTSFNYQIYGDEWKKISRVVNEATEIEINAILDAVEKSISFIKFKLGFNSFSLLPYGNQLYMIHNYFLNNKDKVDESELEKQFYLAALTGVPKNNPSSVEKLLQFYSSNFASSELNTKLTSQYSTINIPKFSIYFSARSAYSKVLLNLIIRKNIREYNLTSFSDIQEILDDYIFPPTNLSREFKERVGNKVFKKNIQDLSHTSNLDIIDIVENNELELENEYNKLVRLIE